MITTSFVFDFRKRAKAGTEGMIDIRITDKRKSYYISTGVKVRKSEWRECAVVDRPDSDMLNRRLAVLIGIVGKYIDESIMNGKAIDVEEIKRKVWQSPEAEKENFLEWVEKQIPRLRIQNATKKRYNVMLNRMKEFGKIVHWSEITVQNIYLFDEFLHNIDKRQSDADMKAGEAKKKISYSAVHNYHKCLKSILSRAERFGLIEKNPYDCLRGEFKRVEATVSYLTEEEMDAFEQLRPLKGTLMAISRDLFVFQMHTGMSFADTQAFDFSNYQKIDGYWTYIGPRVKTGIDYIARLDDTCLEILTRYNFQLPKINNADYNHTLKALGMCAGIQKNLHSHLARHTFATYMLSRNAKIENVAKMLGHKNTTQTLHYAKVLPKSVFDDFDRIRAEEKEKKEGV